MKNIRGLILIWATLLVLVSPTGCNTMEPETYEATAIVLSHNQSVAALGEAILEVFNADGYTPLTNSQTEFVFEKASGTWGNIAYGTLMDPKVWLRAKVRIEKVNSTTQRLSVDLFRIRARGTSMEEKQHLRHGYVGEYRKLLEAVVSKAGTK